MCVRNGRPWHEWSSVSLTGSCGPWRGALTPWQACFFFFQAEDGIRDLIVTGVQTCALPISDSAGLSVPGSPSPGAPRMDQAALGSLGKQPARQVLRTHQERTQAARRGNGDRKSVV